MYSPIVIFGYNRPGLFAKMVKSLLNNIDFHKHDVFVFIDGPKPNQDVTPIQKVIEIAKTISDNVSICPHNKGLATSIIDGVTEVINKYGSAIVIEDDLILHPQFLNFMDFYLDKFKAEKKIFSICGFGLKIKRPDNYCYDIYLSRRASSWGWATWADRWNAVDWEVKSYPKIKKSSKLRKQFNLGGSDMYNMLDQYMKGQNNSWAIRFCFHQFLHNLYSIHPFRSLVSNAGYGQDATNCKQAYNRFKIDKLPCNEKLLSLFSDNSQDTSMPLFSTKIDTQLRAYHSIPIRIYSRLRRLLRF